LLRDAHSVTLSHYDGSCNGALRFFLAQAGSIGPAVFRKTVVSSPRRASVERHSIKSLRKKSAFSAAAGQWIGRPFLP